MAKQNIDSKIVIGALIGGLISIGTMGIICALRKEKGSSLNSLEEMMSYINEIFENHQLEEPAAMKDLGRKLHKHKAILIEIIDWVAIGFKLWKKFKN